MAEKMAVCGYRCGLCPVYQGNLERIGEEEVRAGFLKYFGHDFGDYLTGCKGCPEGGDGGCTVKACAREKNIANCGLCPQLPCDKLQEKMGVIEKYFDDISAVPKHDQAIYVEPYRSKERLSKIKQNSKER